MLKPIEPQSTITVVWHKDPAVKSHDDDYADMVCLNPSCWKDKLEIREGQKPLKFILGPIPPSDLTRIEDDAGFPRQDFKAHTLFWSCFVSSLREIDGLGDTPKRMVNGVEYIDPQWVEKNFYGPIRMAGIFAGRVAWTWNNAGETDEKNS